MKYTYPVEKIAKILRTKPEIIDNLADSMNSLCHKDGIMHQIVAENDFRVKEILNFLGLNQKSTSEEVYLALVNKLKKGDETLFGILEKPTCTTQGDCKTLFSRALEVSGVDKGYFLKKEKACEMLEKHPPQNIINALGYKNVKELLDKENFYEVYASLRFAESSEWMHEFLEKCYQDLKPFDFEKRKIEVLLLDGKWLEVAKMFIEKKYHNVSHLKELGVIFVIPLRIEGAGETLRVFTLLLHYLHEVDFYSKIIEKYGQGDDFANNLISALKGEIREEKKLPEGSWRIVQQYLAKKDVNDFRLFEPHVNPETIHWDKAENDLSKLDAIFPELDFTFWKDLNFVGGFFKAVGKEIDGVINNRIMEDGELQSLVSLNLIDSVMSLVKEKEMIKYLFHHQEALWNKIFIEYLGRTGLEKLTIDNFDKGYIAKEDIDKYIK